MNDEAAGARNAHYTQKLAHLDEMMAAGLTPSVHLPYPEMVSRVNNTDAELQAAATALVAGYQTQRAAEEALHQARRTLTTERVQAVLDGRATGPTQAAIDRALVALEHTDPLVQAALVALESTLTHERTTRYALSTADTRFLCARDRLQAACALARMIGSTP